MGNSVPTRGPTGRPLLRAVLAVAVVCSLVGVATTPAVATPGVGFGQSNADDVLLRADVAADGDADWTVEYRFRLADDNSSEAFRTLAADVDSNPENFTERFGDRIRETARAAENVTGREMTIRNVSVGTERRSLPQGEFGVVVYTFEWTNFAAVDGDEITAGDALAGLFLEEGTSLMLTWPAEYELQAASPADYERGDRSVVWRGPADFGPSEPELVVARPGARGGLPLALVGGIVVILVAGAGAVLYRRGAFDGRSAGGATAAGGGAPDEGTTVEDAPDTGDAARDDPPDELLSNEERVLRLIERNGGRMKQQEVVEALGWTDAKTSQVVRDLRDEGKLDGFRLGRENVLRLPEEGG